jgi:hypothetical protein
MSEGNDLDAKIHQLIKEGKIPESQGQQLLGAAKPAKKSKMPNGRFGKIILGTAVLAVIGFTAYNMLKPGEERGNSGSRSCAKNVGTMFQSLYTPVFSTPRDMISDNELPRIVSAYEAHMRTVDSLRYIYEVVPKSDREGVIAEGAPAIEYLNATIIEHPYLGERDFNNLRAVAWEVICENNLDSPFKGNPSPLIFDFDSDGKPDIAVPACARGMFNPGNVFLITNEYENYRIRKIDLNDAELAFFERHHPRGEAEGLYKTLYEKHVLGVYKDIP